MNLFVKGKDLLPSNRKIVLLINIYIFLILYDGIFRKWVFPSLSSSIMALKQLVAVCIVLYGLKYINKMTGWEKSFAFIGFIVFLLTLLFGHGNIFVDIWGCLPYWFGLTVCFIIGKLLSVNDLYRLGKIIVYTSILNSILVIIQFQLPVSHILNSSEINESMSRISDMSAADLAGAFRPSGIFIYNTGNTTFTLLAYSFILYFLFVKQKVLKRNMLFLSLVLVVLSSLCSASRTCVFYVLGMTLFFILTCLKGKSISKIIKFIAFSVPIVIIISFTSVGKKACDNLQNRFDNASESQYGEHHSTTDGTLNDIFDRTIKYNIGALIDPHPISKEDVPFFGFGQGMSTQVGAKLLNLGKGSSGFSLAEWDGLRIVCESGILFGWIIIYIRLGYVLRFCGYISRCRKRNYCLPIILFPSFFLAFYLTSTWGNAFNANYAFLIGGLFLVAKNNEKIVER